MMWIALAYFYLAGVLNGLLIVGLDRERLDGEMPSPRKILLATILWPLLMPYLFVKGGFSK